MKFAIITGASKGLGASIAERMINEKIGVIAVSRTDSSELKEKASVNEVFYQHFSCNLAFPEEVEKSVHEILSLLESKKAEVIYVINNAGVIEPIATAGALDHQALIANVQINLIAPIMITNIVLKNAIAPLKIVNVSSGAAERPIQGWSAYCGTKAGLNMFTETAAAEQKTAGAPHEIIAFSPGIMDTDMQGTIRASAKEAFKDLEKFKEYKEKGMLRPAKVVADALVNLLLEDQIDSGKIYRVNDLI
ncbi:(S)-benzoin forming benzil reductase [Bacillus sp. DTU_2020_1000418_1_SI_GHA_SEK_038]|uniref:(S)-benzoin forming benzil reductase n=1 Tax=Bacillus sp. DTU_2020_1000418_1_SI_GHA_SEK_038 TaxID=3077585 RepID=UPI0028EA3438|nr:(S)-benzoin forming benzil reductase [Bacillus sp. DTU_2020_1000418_1_SI_GHA_SEK_038]WNS74884.1 (S)-benzoin forming benzil reductase [Bacillus sp. DTU_2020_1000418_1_SI_GHA_SEK_038]